MYKYSQMLLSPRFCVNLVITYLLSKTLLYITLLQVLIRLPRKLLCQAIFPDVLHHGHLIRAAHSRGYRSYPRHRTRARRPAWRAIDVLAKS